MKDSDLLRIQIDEYRSLLTRVQRAKKKNAFKKGKGDKREDASRNNSAEESIVVQTYLKKGMDDAKDCRA